MDNTSLVEQCKNGDREAMGQLYSLYSGRMMKIIRHYVHDPEVASDILHDGFIVAFTQIAKLRDCDKLEFWLGTIMKNLSIQYLNQLELTTLLNDDIDVPEIPEIQTLISYEELEAIINLLPDGYRKVFKLAVLDNMSHAEIGKLLGIAPHSSSSQLFRAKEMLRRIIREHGLELSGAIGIILLLGSLLPRLLSSYISFDTPEIASNIPETNTIYITKAPAESRATATSVHSDLSGETALTQHPASFGNSDMAENSNTAEDAAISESPVISGSPAFNEHPVVSESAPVTETPMVSENAPLPENAESATENANSPEQPSHHYIVPTAGNGSRLNLAVNTSFSSGNSGSIPGDYNFDFSDNLTGMPPQPPFSTDVDNGYSDVKHQPTISVTVTANYMLTRTLGIESGMSYSYLRSEATKSKLRHRFRYHYIGIPLKLNLSFFSTPTLRIYGSAGAGIDIPVAASRDDSFEKHSISAPVQWSLTGGIGIQLHLTRRVSLYAEPSVRYNFHNDNSDAINKWADERLQFTLPIGLRLNL